MIAAQIASRQLQIKVNPGPVVNQVTPNKKIIPPPYFVNGINFQAGAQVIFKPGVDQVTVNPVFVSSSQLRIDTAIPSPAGGGSVTVRVRNPDGGFGDKPNAFVFARLRFPRR